MAKRKTKYWKVTGDLCLSDVGSIRLVLENGKAVRLAVSDELYVSCDPEEMREEALTAHARYAFWGYQAERLLRQVREAERALDTAEANADLIYRKWLLKENGDYREAQVAARVRLDKDVLEARKALESIQLQYGHVKVMRDAHRERCKILTTLVAHVRKES